AAAAQLGIRRQGVMPVRLRLVASGCNSKMPAFINRAYAVTECSWPDAFNDDSHVFVDVL
ncbi:hypothetical protein, partial [Pseudomonas aeruginosa]|uniref:hypothetical protein n=1 Tax=Pseudomonas aeruginosa TaxID=287 RepID=UPI001E5C2C5B